MTEQEQLEAFYASLIVDLTPLEDSASTEAYVTELFQAVLGRDPSAQGLANISAAVDAGTFDMDEFMNSALNADLSDPAFDYLSEAERAAAQASQDALTAEQDAFNIDHPVVIPEPEPEVEATGDTIYLTSGTDRDGDFNGTADADQFNAYIQQNSFAGGVSNSLSSADVLDGGTGTDTLYAELVPEFFGVTGDNQVDVQPRTSNIEIIELEARDGGSNDIYSSPLVTVDAKYMTDIDSIGSKFSDGDLVIENLTTLESNGNARNTEDITITMDHTDNFNSDEDASDLTVYFDEDYLLAGQSKTTSQANYWMLDEDSEDYVTEPLLNIERDGVTLTIDGVAVEIVMDTAVAAAADTWTQYAAGLQDVIDAMIADGNTLLEGLTVAVDAANGDETYNDQGVLVPIPAITITDAHGRDLVPTGFVSPEEATGNFDIYGRFDNVASTSTNNPVTVNVDLHKVGREGEGGDLIVGGKELDSDGGAENQGNGIPVFNIDVLGDDSKPSNLSTITSTNDALRVVNIATHDDYVDGESFASLTVRGSGTSNFNSTVATGTNPFGGTLETLNANSFFGDLDIGQDTAALNIDTFTATGGGNVTLVEDIDGSQKGNFSVTTGSGADTITVDLDGDAVDTDGTGLAINTGSNEDSVTLLGSGNVSNETTDKFDNLNVNTGADADTVNLLGTHNYDIVTAAGSDTVNVDSDNANDTGSWTVGDTTVATGLDWADRVLYQATLTVDFAGFSETVTVVTTAANNFVATQLDINAAIRDAIASNPELARLLAVSDNTGDQQIAINSMYDGQNDLTINVTQPDVILSGGAAATANQVIVSSSHFTALENGFLATEATLENGGTEFDSSFIDAVNTESDIQDVFDGSWGGNIMQGNLNETGAAVADDFVLDSFDGTDGSTTNNGIFSVASIDMGTGTNDLVVLDNDINSSNTLIFSAAWGKVSVINFFEDQLNDDLHAGAANNTVINHTDETVANHILDFTAWLDDKNTTSGSTDSAERDATVSNTADSVANIDLDANLVSVLNDFAQATGETWAGLTASQLSDALNGTDDHGNITAVFSTSVNLDQGTLLGTSINSILMIENDLNDGEYKVFNVETTDVNAVGEAFSVSLLGTIDFGESVNAGLADANFTGAAVVMPIM